MNFWRHVKVVLWSFIGLGRRKHQAELRDTNPLIFIAVAFALVLVFIGTLVTIAHRVA
jgi:hypothetical protein